MYENMSFEYLLDCPNNMTNSSLREHKAEYGVFLALKNHKYRTYNEKEASLFYIPFFPCISYHVGKCNNITHYDRMRLVRDMLVSSPSFKKHHGKNYMWASTCDSVLQNHQSFYNSMYPLSNILRNTIAGRFKKFPYRSMSSVAKYTFAIPFFTDSKEINTQKLSRKYLLYFSGSHKVCCAGRLIREQLKNIDKNRLVVIHETTRYPNVNNITVATNNIPNSAILINMQTMMKRSIFCLIPAGDSCVTSRLVTSIQNDCIPIVICDSPMVYFSRYISYTPLYIKGSLFVKNPNIVYSIINRSNHFIKAERQRLQVAKQIL
jgi:hypothetical protein